MGSLREELRRNLLNAGAALVGYAELKNDERLPYPALPRVVSFAVRLEPKDDSVWEYARAYFDAEEKIALLGEHAKACLRRYGFSAETMPKAFLDGENPGTVYPTKEAAEAAHLATRGASAGDPLTTPEHGRDVRFGTVFTNATWKKKE